MTRSLDRVHIERLLAEIVHDIPQIQWIALVNGNGDLIGSFPSRPGVGGDKISTMSVAMSSLGERIAAELQNGRLQYTVIAGVDAISVMIALDAKYLLAIGLKKDTSIEEFLRRMEEVNIPILMKMLRTESVSKLSGISPY